MRKGCSGDFQRRLTRIGPLARQATPHGEKFKGTKFSVAHKAQSKDTLFEHAGELLQATVLQFTGPPHQLLLERSALAHAAFS